MTSGMDPDQASSDGSVPGGSDRFSVFITVDEWRRIIEWMHYGLSPSELDPTGHFLLECSGTRRTWVTTDGDRMTVLHDEGPAPVGLTDPSEPVSILVNSRFFRARAPEDVTLVVTSVEDGRRQTFRGDGFELSLPEHPGPFPEWRTVVSAVTGTEVRVDAEQMARAARTAAVAPMGVENAQPLHAWIYGHDGRLVLETPWVRFPHTLVHVDTDLPVPDTVPVLVVPRLLAELVEHLGPSTVTLTLPPTPLHTVGIRSDGYEAVLRPTDRWGAEKVRLEELLCEFLGSDEVNADSDGDYPITSPQGNRLWVRLHTGVQPISVQVFSVLATDVDCTEDLLRELNSINAAGAYVKVIWADGAVMAETDIVADSLDLSELANAVIVVSQTADRYRDVLSAFFGSVGDDAE